jgi:septin family protein
MVAGYSGLGKTSFIRTLFGTLKSRTAAGGLKNKSSSGNLLADANKKASSPTSPSSPNPNGMAARSNGPQESMAYVTGNLVRTMNSFEALFEIEEGNEKINLTLVDTPGFVGSDEVVDKHCDEILRYIEYQFDLTLDEVR